MKGRREMGLSTTFKALSDPTRRRILQMLRKRDMTAGEIADKFHVSKPSISHHLNTLKNAGMITDERQGQFIYYSLNTSVFEDVISFSLGIMEDE